MPETRRDILMAARILKYMLEHGIVLIPIDL
jgi:hypothetical protein